MTEMRIFKHSAQLPFLLLGVGELVILYTSVYIAASLQPAFTSPSTGLLPFALVFCSIINLTMVLIGLYEIRLHEGMVGVILRTAIAFILAGIIMMFLSHLIPELAIGLNILITAEILAFFIVITCRRIFFDMLDEDSLKRKILIYGTGEKAAAIMQRMRRQSDQRGFKILGFVHLFGQPDQIAPEKVIQLHIPLKDFAKEKRIDEIVIAVDEQHKDLDLEELLDCKMQGIEVIDSLTFFEREAGKIRIDLLNPNWLVLSNSFKQNDLRLFGKRIFDIAASLTILLITWPLMVLASTVFLRRAKDSCAMLDRQIHLGHGGKPFAVLSFQKTSIDASKNGWKKFLNIFLKQSWINILPQLFNVIRGDMSFVGPSPDRVGLETGIAERIPYYKERYRLKPGITGWAQLCYPYTTCEQDLIEKQQFDLYYLKHHNFLFDLMILIQFAKAIFLRKGWQ